MKFYIASRTSEIEKVQEMCKRLTDLGHEISYDWTKMEDADLPRPYKGHEEKVRNFAEKEIHGVKDADIFIILSDKNGTGMYVEMGVALASGAKVYTIGGHNDATVFHFHPNVIKMPSFEDVLKDLGI